MEKLIYHKKKKNVWKINTRMPHTKYFQIFPPGANALFAPR
jgi:hypothetical protein